MVRTKETLATGHYMSVINILMQLRKVCNHPDLFDPRPTVSPFHMEALVFVTASLVERALEMSHLEVSKSLRYLLLPVVVAAVIERSNDTQIYLTL